MLLIIEDKKIRRMSMKNFKEMIYANHFGKNYLELEKNKKSLETQVGWALKDTYCELAKELSEMLEAIIKIM
mgnify:CR=1 FL=1